MNPAFDIIVVGGGHSGSEAAMSAARLGMRVLMVTSSLDTIGQMSCNPAIGGIAKGTVAREVDALGGIMGRATDRARIQFRMLNRSKGAAVWSPRAQCDRGLYRSAVRNELEKNRKIQFLQATVASLLLKSDRVVGVETGDGTEITGRSVILTAGTFLRGKIHIGTETRVSAGRAGDPAVVSIAEQMESLGLIVARFKTGTPPRIDGRTVDLSMLERQDSDELDYDFSQFLKIERPGSRPCWITWAGEELKEIVRGHLAESALYGGEISGRGPRYCPSIEDKIVKFPNAPKHQVFLEPEGLSTSEMYVNGLSTSLPAPVQLEFLRVVPGLEYVEMTRPGYAIEYDYYPPQQLTPWLELKAIRGLFFAGQINGTTGYEEAAGQGVVAGVNAARLLRNEEPVVFGRDTSYIGVLVDDLVTRGVDEPYRLFTSRAEFRLLLRQDNALVRLGPLADKLGMLSDEERGVLERRLKEMERIREEAASSTIRPSDANPILSRLGQTELKETQRITDFVKRPNVALSDAFEAAGTSLNASEEALFSAEIELRYVGYMEREREAVRKLSELTDFSIPSDLPYFDLVSLSTEARQKLDQIRPESLAQAGRVPGVSPSDLQNLVFEVLRRRRAVA